MGIYALAVNAVPGSKNQILIILIKTVRRYQQPNKLQPNCNGFNVKQSSFIKSIIVLFV